MRKLVAKLMLFTLLFNLLPIFGGVNNVMADDIDGTANLNMSVSASVDDSSIGYNYS